MAFYKRSEYMVTYSVETWIPTCLWQDVWACRGRLRAPNLARKGGILEKGYLPGFTSYFKARPHHEALALTGIAEVRKVLWDEAVLSIPIRFAYPPVRI